MQRTGDQLLETGRECLGGASDFTATSNVPTASKADGDASPGATREARGPPGERSAWRASRGPAMVTPLPVGSHTPETPGSQAGDHPSPSLYLTLPWHLPSLTPQPSGGAGAPSPPPGPLPSSGPRQPAASPGCSDGGSASPGTECTSGQTPRAELLLVPRTGSSYSAGDTEFCCSGPERWCLPAFNAHPQPGWMGAGGGGAAETDEAEEVRTDMKSGNSGRTAGRKSEWAGGRENERGQTGRWTEERRGSPDGWYMDGRMDRRMDGWINGWVGGWVPDITGRGPSVSRT